LPRTLRLSPRDGALIKVPSEITGIPVNHITVYMDVPELIVDVVLIGSVRKMPVGANPTPASPTVIVWAATVPIPIAIEPRTYDETGTEPDTGIETGTVIPEDVRIILRHVNDLRLGRFDLDVVGLNDYLLLGVGPKNPISHRYRAQTLNRPGNILRLRDVGLPDSRSPLRVFRHHLKNRRIVRERLHTHVPVLGLN